MSSVLLQSLLLFLTPILQLMLGQQLVAILIKAQQRLSRSRIPQTDDSPYLGGSSPPFLIGLLAHLSMAFFLKCLGLSWWAACFLPLLPTVLSIRSLPSNIRSLLPKPNINFTLWLIVVLVLGTTIFEAINGIQTYWKNNYGDLPFHLGMITSFVYGNNFPPQYHFYPGETLSYPFLINFWSALLWWPNPTFEALHLIFVVQWVILCCIIYHALNGNRYPLLPWAVLFGGGTYFSLASNSGGTFINQGYPWTSFLTCIWIPQRSSLFGAACALVVLKLLRNTNCFNYVIAAAILGLMPLVHTHTLITLLGFIAIYQIIEEFHLVYNKPISFFKLQLLRFWPLAIGIIFLPWLIGKSDIGKFTIAWMAKDVGSIEQVMIELGKASQLWLVNCWQVFLVAFLFLPLTRKFKVILSLFILFFAANLYQLAIWNWDQIKIFIALYLVLLASWSAVDRPTLLMRLAHPLLLILIVPSLYETWLVLRPGGQTAINIYSVEDLEQAKQVRLHTAPDAVILSAPAHNSQITLTGRFMYLGYEGQVASHGIKFQQRKELCKTLESALSCSTKSTNLCPDYLLWTGHETRRWPNESPQTAGKLKATDLPYLFEIVSKSN